MPNYYCRRCRGQFWFKEDREYCLRCVEIMSK